MLEKLAEADDAFVEPYLEGTFSVNDIQAALRRATLARALTPVLCGSALRNTGVQPVLDAVCNWLPSPADVPAPVGHDPEGREVTVPPDPAAPAVALVFKVLMENGRKLAFLRVYAGSIHEGESLCNTASGKNDRLGHIYHPHADRREQTESASAGEIVVVVGLRSAHTGETYTAGGRRLALESIEAYAPVITLALEPRNADEGKILDEALIRYTEEDPTLQARLDDDTGSRMTVSTTLFEQIEKDYIQAYKAKDSVRVTVLRLLKTAVKNRLVDLKRPGGKLSDEEMLDLIIKEGKQRQDSIDQYTSANRADLADKEAAELVILKEYMPKPLGAEELTALIDATVTAVGATSPKDMGKVISAIMAEHKGRVDGKALSEAVKKRLAQA